MDPTLVFRCSKCNKAIYRANSCIRSKTNSRYRKVASQHFLFWTYNHNSLPNLTNWQLLDSTKFSPLLETEIPSIDKVEVPNRSTKASSSHQLNPILKANDIKSSRLSWRGRTSLAEKRSYRKLHLIGSRPSTSKLSIALFKSYLGGATRAVSRTDSTELITSSVKAS